MSFDFTIVYNSLQYKTFNLYSGSFFHMGGVAEIALQSGNLSFNMEGEREGMKVENGLWWDGMGNWSDFLNLLRLLANEY